MGQGRSIHQVWTTRVAAYGAQDPVSPILCKMTHQQPLTKQWMSIEYLLCATPCLIAFIKLLLCTIPYIQHIRNIRTMSPS